MGLTVNLNVVFVAVVLLLAGWGLSVMLRDRGPASLADIAAGIIGLTVGGMLVAGLFGEGMVGPLPTALTALGGLVLLLAVRGAATPQTRPLTTYQRRHTPPR